MSQLTKSTGFNADAACGVRAPVETRMGWSPLSYVIKAFEEAKVFERDDTKNSDFSMLISMCIPSTGQRRCEYNTNSSDICNCHLCIDFAFYCYTCSRLYSEFDSDTVCPECGSQLHHTNDNEYGQVGDIKFLFWQYE